jgi:hypothetical protein
MNELCETYTVLLDDIYSKLVMSFNKIQLQEYSKNTLEKSDELVRTGSQILTTLKTHVANLETLLVNTAEYSQEIKDDLSHEPTDEYVFVTKNGMLGYPGKDFIHYMKYVKQFKKNKAAQSQTQSVTQSVVQSVVQPVVQPSEKHLITEIGYYLKLPSVSDLNDIPSAMYFYNNGIYMRLPNNNVVKIPFPETVDSKKEYDRKHSIRCKYQTKTECVAQRKKMANLHNSQVRICNYAHENEKLIKIGYPSRCPNVPNFGNPTTMSQDIKHVNKHDIKNTLMYGLSDLVSCVVYFDYNNINNLLLDRLDTF